MTEQGPTSRTGTPLWQPSAGTVQPGEATGQAPSATPAPDQPSTPFSAAPAPGPAAPPPYQAPSGQGPYQGVAPQQSAHQVSVPYGQPPQHPYQGPHEQYGYGQGPAGYGLPTQAYPPQPGFPPPPPGWDHPQPYRPVAALKPSALPVEPKRYSQFLQTPRRRLWKGFIALLVAVVAWLVEQTVVAMGAIIYDAITQRVDFADATALTNFVLHETTHITPAFFLANNISIVLMIPCAWLGMTIYGQRPRWLSSVVGGLRWRWLFRILGLLLLPYAALEVLSAMLGQIPQLSWKPYSVFMIFAILLTTPLQCAGEEYGLRGFINRVFGSYGSSRVSFWVGGIVSSTLFMLLHNAQDVYLNTFYFTFALTSCWLAWRTGGLEAGIAMHVVNNMFAMAVLPFTDFSGMFNRGAGSADPVEVLPLAGVLIACVGIIEWQVRRHRPVAVAAPGAAGLASGQMVTAGALQA